MMGSGLTFVRARHFKCFGQLVIGFNGQWLYWSLALLVNGFIGHWLYLKMWYGMMGPGLTFIRARHFKCFELGVKHGHG